MSCEACGWAAAFISMLSFGSFGVPIKMERAKSVNIDPLVFQSYKTAMCFLTCWLVLLAGVPFRFTPWGIVSGLFWVPGGVATVYAIKVAGIAIGIGTGSCFIVLVSFIWGIFIFDEQVHSRFGASFAIFCMMGGLAGMAYFSSPESASALDNVDASSQGDGVGNEIMQQERSRRTESGSYAQVARQEVEDNGQTSLPAGSLQLEKPINTSDRTPPTILSDEVSRNSGDSCDVEDSFADETTTMSPTSAPLANVESSEEEADSVVVEPVATYIHICGCRITERICGILAAALVTGVWGGSILVPMKWAGSKTDGVAYVISFGIGASIVTVVLWVIRLLYNAHHYGSLEKAYETLPSFHIRVMWLPGMIGGLLWSVGNFFSMISVFYLGEGVGYPLVQTSILVSGLWGIFFFREITGVRRISSWLASASLAIFGILLLSYEHVAR